jgi:isopentenyl diphosphate isomerase/L-lactate dehydrogenase-like FMN-dependent dehydrogenase
MTTAAKPLLKPALVSSGECLTWFKEKHQELKVAMFCAGVKDIPQLSRLKLTLV